MLVLFVFFFKPKQNWWLKIYLHLKEFKRGIGQITKSAKQLFLNYVQIQGSVTCAIKEGFIKKQEKCFIFVIWRQRLVKR